MKVISNPVAVIANYINQSASTSIIGLARSLLALGLLLTLIFNDINVLIPAQYIATLNQHSMRFHGNFFFLLGPSHLNLTRLIAVAVLMLIITGYYIQVTSILHCWITASFVLIRSAYLGGDGTNALLTLLLIPVCLFDKRKNHWDTYHPENNNFYLIQNMFLFFIKIQVAFIYANSVFRKLHVQEWRDGTVIYYWFNHNFFGLNAPFSDVLKPLFEHLPFSVSIAWGTLLFEALLSAGFLFPGKMKWVLLKWGILFHFLILLIHGFALLFFAMSAALFLYLYPAKKSFTLNLFLDER